MSKPRYPDPVKLISSIFGGERALIAAVIEDLSGEFGAPDFISEWMPFDYTDYYHQEMGPSLVRRFVSFEDLIDPGMLPRIKKITNRIEETHGRDGCRKVNIDPGYISRANLILATGKEYAHRPYVGDGIYADLTLIYHNNTFHPLEWTYPDYGAKGMCEMFNILRKRYLIQLTEKEREGTN